MNKFKKLFILTLFLASIAKADIVSVEIPTTLENIKTVKGIIVSQNKIRFIDNVNYIQNKNNVSVSFSVDGSDKGDFVGAFLQSENGEKVYSTLKTISKRFDEDGDLPICTSKKADITLLAGQESALRELVSTRKQRQDLLKNEINKLLNEDMLYTLSNLEKYFGLNYDKPLDVNLESEELLFRLSYLKNAVKNLDLHKLNRVRIEKEGLRD